MPERWEVVMHVPSSCHSVEPSSVLRPTNSGTSPTNVRSCDSLKFRSLQTLRPDFAYFPSFPCSRRLWLYLGPCPQMAARLYTFNRDSSFFSPPILSSPRLLGVGAPRCGQEETGQVSAAGPSSRRSFSPQGYCLKAPYPSWKKDQPFPGF